MAKQSGLHQIRGKVGEHSYYRQTGVSAGLIRSINQGLSARVKTGDEYANTRLNNAEFGQACRIAAALVKYIVPKYRPMMLTFSQGKLAKDVLSLIKSSTGSWGARNLVDYDGSKVAPFVSSLAKTNFDDYGITIVVGADTTDLDANQIILNAKLQAIGADGLDVRAVYCGTWVGKFVLGEGKYAETYANMNIQDIDDFAGSLPATLNGEYPAAPSELEPYTSVRNLVIIVLPYRTINGTNHYLQEHCTFKCFKETALGD